MSTDMLQLLSLLQRVPVETAVSLLKGMNEQRAAAQGSDGESGTAAPGAGIASGQAPFIGILPSQLAARPELTQLVHLLMSIHALSGHQQPRPAAYEQIFRRFTEFQTQLRRQKLAVERLIGHAFTSTEAATALAPAFQQTIHLQARRGAAASGRFRCVNRKSHPVTVEFEPGAVLGDRTGSIDAALLEISPARCSLAPNASTTLTALLDLSACAELADDHVDAGADILMDNEVALKLWISVELHDE